MTAILETATTLAALLAMIPVLVLFAEVLGALFPPAEAEMEAAPNARRPRVAILVPAHDEAAGIAATLENLQGQLADGDRLLVVADNCSDATAQAARAAGAEVLERRDGLRRGKGYALDHGVRYLAADPPRVLVIVDADCTLDPGTVDALARRCIGSGRPVQALDLMHAPPGAGLKVRMAEFAWLVKNLVRPLGLRSLGLPCQLMGTGMAFPWPLIAGANLASGHIAEDLKLGLDLALAGTPPLLEPAGRVRSRFPADPAGVRQQRVRWEHGHLSVILAETPPLLRAALARREAPLLALALDLAVPPLALLLLMIAAAGLVSGILHGLGFSSLPLAITLAAAGLFGIAILAAWGGFGREVVSLADLVAALGYALWKIPIYLRFLVGRQVDWIRSKRDAP